MTKALTLIAAGIALTILAITQLVHTFGQASNWSERLEVSFGCAIGYVGMRLLYRWWSTRPKTEGGANP